MAPKDESPDGVNLSRRNFLKSTGVVGLAATVVPPPEAAAQGGPAALGPGEVPVRLNVNGRQLESDDRAARDAAGCASHARGPHGQQARLRPWRLRRLHHARRRAAGLLLFDPGDRGAGQADSQRRGSGERRDTPSRAAGLLRQGRVDVRVLHARIHHGQRRPAGETPESHARSRSGKASTATSAAAAPSRASSRPFRV